MFEFIVRRGTLLAVAVLVFCVLAVAAAVRMPVQMIPDLEVRTVSVETLWPGATPQDVEKEILIEQERFLRSVPGLQRMVSSAGTGRASIRLEFPFGVDINDALIRVNNALSQVPAYPENTDEPRLSTSSFSENAFMYFRLIARDGNPLGLDLNRMQDFAEDYVRPRMERVPGVSRVDVGGGAAREVRIEVDPGRLAERGITLADLRDAVRARNRDASAGDLDSGKRRYLVRTLGRFETVEDLEQLILARSGDSIVRLSDVASVRLDYAELRSVSYSAGQRTLNLSVSREPGSNVIAIKRAMMPVVEDINRTLLEGNGLELRLVSDDVKYVEDSVRNVFQNLLLGAALATFVLYLFLRSRQATLVGMLGIPICTLAAFLGLLLAGRTLNVISLAGIAFAIGMTVDNTIVVLENIERLRRDGMDRLQATLAGSARGLAGRARLDHDDRHGVCADPVRRAGGRPAVLGHRHRDFRGDPGLDGRGDHRRSGHHRPARFRRACRAKRRRPPARADPGRDRPAAVGFPAAQGGGLHRAGRAGGAGRGAGAAGGIPAGG